METINAVDKGSSEFLGSQSCSRHKVSHFCKTTDNNEKMLVFNTRLYAGKEGRNIIV